MKGRSVCRAWGWFGDQWWTFFLFPLAAIVIAVGLKLAGCDV